MMEIVSEVPDWFIYIGALMTIAAFTALSKILWGGHKTLKRDVDDLQKQMARAATLDDLQVISDRMRQDNHATQARLDDILSKLSC